MLGGDRSAHLGFTAFLKADGALRLEWYSGSLNGAFQDCVVPEAWRQMIALRLGAEASRMVIL